MTRLNSTSMMNLHEQTDISSDEEIYALRQAVAAAKSQLDALTARLAAAETAAATRSRQDLRCNDNNIHSAPPPWPLKPSEYQRYGRQLILPEVGLPGQLRLKGSRVLIVGAGGLGCPAAAYLAGAGVGKLGLVDGDTVEASNLHRQIIHSTTKIGMTKVDSAVEYLTALNPGVTYRKHSFHLTPDRAIDLFEKYDLILDCTDHPTSRYLISDACVITGRPLISASALRTEGQLIVLNNPPRPPGDPSGGPCYRCVFPRPPPADSVLSCGEGGILGPVVGVMGVLQALEAIKVLTAMPMPVEANEVNASASSPKPTLLLFSAYSTPPFRAVRMRSRRPDCAACSAHATVDRASLNNGILDYVAFCGATTPTQILSSSNRIGAAEYAQLPRNSDSLLIDVRDATQFEICALPNSINVPWTGDAKSWLETAAARGVRIAGDNAEKTTPDTFVVCRLGNDSQLAARAIMEASPVAPIVKDIRGGFKAWRHEVDSNWPDY